MTPRGLALICALGAALAAPASAGSRASNPAFLGIQMLSGQPGTCLVRSVTIDSPAEAAGLQPGDLISGIDGRPIADCAGLLDAITAHHPGDVVALLVARRPQLLTVHAQLSTRDVLLRKAIGRPMIKTRLIGVEDHQVYDLSAPRGRLAIVGLYNPECVNCAALFGRLLGWARDQAHDRSRKGGAMPLVLAVHTGEVSRDLELLQKSLDVPLATSELPADDARGGGFASAMFGSELVLADRDRLGVIVIDGRGIVQYVGPIAPDSDDTQAVLDELFAVADQALRRRP